MTDTEMCKTCKFWDNHTSECRRYPPSARFERFPLVITEDWCGEWKQKDGEDD